MEKIRNNSAHPGFYAGLRIFARTVTMTGGPFAVTIETGCTSIQFSLGYSGTTLIAPTIGASTTYVGTKTVAFTVPSGGVLNYLISGTNELDDGVALSGAGTVVDFDSI